MPFPPTLGAQPESNGKWARGDFYPLAAVLLGACLGGSITLSAGLWAGGPVWLSWAAVTSSCLLFIGMWQQARRWRSLQSDAVPTVGQSALLAQMIKHTSNSVLLMDMHMRITWSNAAFTRISGYSAADALGKTPEQLLGSGLADPAVLETLADAAKAFAPCRVEVLNRRKDGRLYWLDAEVQPVFDARGLPAGFMEVGADVTEQRHVQAKLEAALREQGALQSALHMHAIVSVADRRGDITEVNDAFCEISGYTREELLDQNHRIVHSGRQPDAFWHDAWRVIASGKPWRGDVCNESKDGTLYWVDTLIAPFMGADGRIEKYTSIGVDITARKQAEQSLARERSALANIIEGTAVGTFEWHLDRDELQVNERFMSICGRPHENMGALSGDAYRDMMNADDWMRANETLRLCRLGATSVYECEVQVRHQDGHMVWVLDRAKVFGPAQGYERPVLVGTRMELSDRKQAEKVLHLQPMQRQHQIDQAARYQQMLDAISDLILVKSASSEIIWANRAYRQFYGLDQAQFNGLSDPLDSAPVYAQCAAMGDEHVFASGEPYELQDEHATGMGDVTKRLHTIKSPLLSSNGRVVAVVSVSRDITLQKQEQEALRVSEAFNKAILDSVSSEIAVLNQHGIILACNEPWRRFSIENSAEHGQPAPNTGIGANYLKICGGSPDDDFTEVSCSEEKIVSNGILSVMHRRAPSYSLEYPCHSPTQQRWFSLHVTPLHMEGGGVVVSHTDISERKLALIALRASQMLLDQTGRIGGVGGWELDLANHEMQCTDQACRILDLVPGHRPTLSEVIHHVASDQQDIVAAAFERGWTSGQGFDLEVPVVTAAGREIWVRMVGETTSVGGHVTQLLGAVQDLTARRTLEAKLREKNDLLVSVMASLPCGLSVFDADLNVTIVNAEFKQLFDLPDSLFANASTPLESLVRHDAARGELGEDNTEAAVQAILARARGAMPLQFDRQRRNGAQIEVRSSRMPDGGMVTTYVDISARRRAEAEAKRSTQLLLGAIEAIDEAFVLYDPDDRLVLCNEKHRAIHDLSKDLVRPGNRLEDILRLGAQLGQYPDAVGRVEEWVSQRIAEHLSGTGTLIQKVNDGRTLRIVERRMPDGHIVGFRTDITDLVRATEAAQAASQSKSLFLANVSHEIRTPMNAVLGMLALLGRTSLTPRQAAYIGKAEGAARSLLELLNNVLDFSKAEAGKMTLELRPFCIANALRDLSVVLSAHVGNKPVELLFDVDPALPDRVIGDALRLKQVLVNLCGNALKFTEAGEVVLSMRLLHTHADTLSVHFAVRDTGIGIAPEHHERIFSGFTQAEGSTTRRFGGTGLGLSISQRLVALMGGELVLESEPGQGSCFQFCIDMQLVAKESGEAASALPAAITAPLCALVVDRNPIAGEVLARIGRGWGWLVDTVVSGEQALAQLRLKDDRGAPYQAVFIEWQMPGIDGVQTGQRIREMSLKGAQPMMFMVGAQGRERLYELTHDQQSLWHGFLVKPITSVSLSEAMQQAKSTGTLPSPASRLAPELYANSEVRLPGMRLLVVEDNPNNQQVARELLEGEGALVHLAQNGQEAVDILASRSAEFDVVLMDLQMPVMDGLTATRLIRGELAIASLPILAMTANAMASDREDCLAAGMNDHIGKPFMLDELVDKLRHQVRLGSVASSQLSINNPLISARSEALAYDAGIDLKRALIRLGGNLDIYCRALETFVDDLQAYSQRLRHAKPPDDLDRASIDLHTLKGLAATLGAHGLSEVAAAGERALQNTASPAQWHQTCSQICADIAAMRPGLIELLDSLKTPLARGHEPVHVAGQLSEQDLIEAAATLLLLRDQLQDADMAATETMNALAARFGPNLHGQFQALSQFVGMLDFDAAFHTCEQILHDLSSQVGPEKVA